MQEKINQALGKLAELYRRESVMEIMVDAVDDIYYEEKGEIHNADFKFSSEQEISEVIEKLFKLAGRDLAETPTGGDIRLPDGTRAMAVLPPVALNGPSLVLRRLPASNPSWNDLIKWGATTQDAVDLLKNILKSDNNLLIVGSLGSGKTTIANLTCGLIPESWRIVVAEKVAEMTLERKRTVRLEAAAADSDSFCEIIQMASKMRVDSLVVNELKGKEAVPTIEMGRAGHQVVATIHADGPIDALKRLELQYMSGDLGAGMAEIREQIARCFGYILFQHRYPDGKRRVSQICRVDGLDDREHYLITPLYRFDEDLQKFTLTQAGKDFS